MWRDDRCGVLSRFTVVRLAMYGFVEEANRLQSLGEKVSLWVGVVDAGWRAQFLAGDEWLMAGFGNFADRIQGTFLLMKFISLGSMIAIPVYLVVCTPASAGAARAAEIEREARSALNSLYAQNPKARELGKHAHGILVFPRITKGGFIVSVQQGDGALITPTGTTEYYRSSAASYGFQAGVQQFGYALFFMNDRSMDDLRKESGWEIGAAPSLVAVDEGISKSLSTTSLNKNIYAFFFDHRGLMGGFGVQGTKLTKIHPR